MKFRNKIILYFLLSILVPSILITTIMYSGSVRIFDKKMNELVEKNLSSVRMLVQQRLAFIDELTTLISMNPLIQEVLSAPPTDDTNDIVTQIIKLDHALDSYYISNYYASTSSPIVPVIHMIDRPAFQRFDISDKVRDISVLEDLSWYPEASGKNTAIVADSQTGSVVITRKLYDLQTVETARYAAFLTVSLEHSFFGQLLETYKPTPGSKTLIYDSGQNLLSSSGDLTDNESAYLKQEFSNLSSSPTRLKLDGRPVVIAAEPLQNADWTIVVITDLNDINSSQNALTWIVVFLIILSMGIALFTALLLSRNLSRPILAIVDSMRTVGDGNFSIDIQYDKNDEFRYLINQYNKMISRIQQLIDGLYISESNKQKAELKAKEMQLKALQAQINPHFLYNTLDSINLSAIKYNVPQISDMINALADFFRYSLSRGEPVITLEKEIRHTQAYLELQAIRHGPNLQYRFLIPGSLYRVRIVKLALQPLVENAVLHGFSSQNHQLSITIAAACSEEDIVISVTDNGTGADAGKLNDILNSPEDHSVDSFAITNVHQRIKNAFGNEYGLYYRDNPQGGLTAEIHLPLENGSTTNNPNNRNRNTEEQT
ncbi:cache domain-containing sensor histidine kinase [Hungatella hathewayi]|nr:sensor histidine kinase [Hungatella hathewayi]